ncbi:MAG: hemolysin family protein [Bacteroidota bacterium]
MAEILIIFCLILLNGVFAMSEISMVSSRKIRLERAAKKGDKGARMALELHQNPSKFLSTVQIGITLIGILTGIYSGEKIEDDLNRYLSQFESLRNYSETLAVTIIVVILTFFSLVLGELVPKRIGLVMPETIARILAFPMYTISLIAAPFIWLLTVTTEALVKVLGISKPKDSQVTEEEIRAIIQEGTEAGTVQEIEQDIVENVFHLGDRKISTLMTQRLDIEWLNIEEPLDTIKSRIIASGHKSFPVCKGSIETVLGILYSKQMLDSMLKNEEIEIEKLLKPAIYFPENTTAYKALEKFREAKQRLALVVDEFGGLQGLLTMNDLVDVLVGDLAEQLHEKKEIVPRDDGTFLVDANLPFPEFVRYFGIEAGDDRELMSINTVGGLVFYLSKKIPKAGDRFKWKDLGIEIIDMDGRRIDKVLARKLKDD